MINLAEIYNSEIRLPNLAAESYRCRNKKNLLLERIDSAIKQEDVHKAVDFINSGTYQLCLDEISSLNQKMLNIHEKQIKLLKLLSQNGNSIN